MNNFVHLHLHSEYSALDGMIKISNLALELNKHEQKACAITDHGTLAGVPEFYWTMKKNNIVPIIGCEFYVDEGLENRFPAHLTILCKNERGYRQLIELNNLGAHQFYDRPRITYQQLFESGSDGLIALSGCMSNRGARYTLAGQKSEAQNLYNKLRASLGGFFFEIQMHELVKGEEEFNNEEKLFAQFMWENSQELNIPAVITNDAHYLDKKSEDIHREIIRLGRESSGKDYRGLEFSGTGFYIKNQEEMWNIAPVKIRQQLFENVGNLVKEIGEIKIAEFEKSTWHMPQISISNPIEVIFDKAAQKGRLKNKPQEYIDRWDEEIKVIEETSFGPVFLISLDYVDEAKRRGILVGPGRGSMVGSLVSYAIGITDVDPIEHNLMFKRAINPARPSIPDFDIDFQGSRRKEIFEYLKEKYGDNSLHIGTASKYTLKGALKQVLRVLNIPFMEANDLNKTLDELITWEDINELFSQDCLEKYIKLWPELIDMVSQLNGNIFAAGSHAAGVVISDNRRPLRNEIPISRMKEDGFASSFDMEVLKKLGFVKFDILGLTALDIIDDASKFASIEFDYLKLDLKDKKVYDLINKEKYHKIFQIEGGANIQVIRAMGGIQEFEDIVAMNALGRPGAIQFLKRFCAWRKDHSSIIYPDKKLANILDVTHGVILYQEQVMQIVADLAGFNDHRVDDIKEAIKFFRHEVFAEIEPEFIEGCKNNNIENAHEIWDMIKSFSGYGFNRSHAVAYAILGFATAWLKTYYPVEFYAAALSHTEQDSYQDIVAEAKSLGVEFIPPHINYSKSLFNVVDGKIMFGISSVKFCSASTAEEIISKRPFQTVLDFETRVAARKCNSRSRKNLELIGAYAGLGGDPKYSLIERRKSQKELIGVAVEYSSEETELLQEDNPRGGIRVGILSAEKRILTKKGDPMGFLKFESGPPDITIFPELWQQYRKKNVKQGDILRIVGNLERQRNSFIAEDIQLWN